MGTVKIQGTGRKRKHKHKHKHSANANAKATHLARLAGALKAVDEALEHLGVRAQLRLCVGALRLNLLAARVRDAAVDAGAARAREHLLRARVQLLAALGAEGGRAHVVDEAAHDARAPGLGVAAEGGALLAAGLVVVKRGASFVVCVVVVVVVKKSKVCVVLCCCVMFVCFVVLRCVCELLDERTPRHGAAAWKQTRNQNRRPLFRPPPISTRPPARAWA